MQHFAHVVDGTVRERIDLDDGLKPGRDIFTADFAEHLVACDQGVTVGMVYANGTFSEAPAPAVSVPSTVSSAQAKIMLRRTPGSAEGKSLLDEVKAALDTTAGTEAGDEAAIWFADARQWERSNPHVAEIGGALGLNAGQIDDLFRSAAQIQA